jgi:ABC-type phosphate transport system permease subunit
MVVLDWGLATPAARRVFDAMLWLVGIAAIIYGIWALWVWVS